ncbi:nitrous oxide reductase accessory protein NosL [Neobacillus drentensis]|uniref:nitrous oxide reductase accessory protein NosL n=1 Tax=Neobacillus drentensis TaxID=220684 RepID=UPI002FFD7918
MKNHLLKTVLLTIISLFVIAGCGKKEYKPVTINEKTDKCEICHMAVKNNQFATEIILKNGKSMVFDDIGCMYKWMKENKDKKVANSYVKDYQTKEWIESEKASYVYDKPIKTPMAYNVITFTDKKDAQSFIDKNGGTLLTYANLEKHSWEKNEKMVKEMKEKMKQMKMDGGKEGMDMKKSEDTH